MELKVKAIGEDTVELEVRDEDLSVVEIIHQELLEDRRATFSGVTQPHPLYRHFILRLQTEGADPLTVLKDRVKGAVEKAARLEALIREAGS
jgi:DNA-directed RNA polymerase subunit L